MALSQSPNSIHREMTLCFADMAGFTALTEAHGDEAAADHAIRFAQWARDALGAGDLFVKSIGDAVLIASPAPVDALGCVTRLLDRALADAAFPIVRVGMHHGSVVERDGDLFGSCVNVAARLAALARGGQVLASSAIADAARSAGMTVTSLGPQSLKNLREAIEVFAISTNMDRAGAIDPICRMRVDPSSAAGMVRRAGVEFWFCSPACAKLFLESDSSQAARSKPA